MPTKAIYVGLADKLVKDSAFTYIHVARAYVLPGANPTTSSYNAGDVKSYSGTNSMAGFYNKNYFSLT
jgi:hypothetical protein